MKKGFSIIELIIALGAASIITTVMVSMVLKSKFSYINKSKENRQYFYSMEALMFMKNEIDEAKSVSIASNIIELKYLDETIRKNIKLSSNHNIVIVHLKGNAVMASNNIITNVKDFEIVEKGSLIYLTIISQNGEKFEKCISIKKAA
jgi:Tfp pilus assembly protein PilE